MASPGPTAELKNLPSEVVETFRRQISLVNLIGETRPARLNPVLTAYTARQTPPFAAHGLSLKETRLPQDGQLIEMTPHRREWLTLDPLSYFIISLDRERGEICLERYTQTERKLTHIVRGRAADLLYHTAIKENLLTQFDHAAYLGAELAKAETALYNNLPYEQDRKLLLK